MQNKTLTELLQDLEQEMLRLKYNKHSISFYSKYWKLLIQFAEERGETCYSEQLGLDFLEKQFGFSIEDCNRPFTRDKVAQLRIIRMIGDFQLHRVVIRQYPRRQQILTDPYFIAISDRFKTFCIEKEYSQATILLYIKLSTKLMNYLICQNITTCEAILLSHIHDYLKTLIGIVTRL